MVEVHFHTEDAVLLINTYLCEQQSKQYSRALLVKSENDDIELLDEPINKKDLEAMEMKFRKYDEEEKYGDTSNQLPVSIFD